MGTLKSLRNAYGALKDKTQIGLAKVHSNFKEIDIAIVKATAHVECPPKERHVRKIFAATSISRPQTDIAYCIQALAKRLSKTKNWIVATKILIVIHRTLREGDPSFRDELLNFTHRGNFLQISHFKDNSSRVAWDCSAWVKTYAFFIEERLRCFRVLQYDIEAERVTKSSGSNKALGRTIMTTEELIEQLPALQNLLSRLIGCQPEGSAYNAYLIQYAVALVLKESFKIYCAMNDGIINLMDAFFEMTRDDAVKVFEIYKRAGQQVEELAGFYEFCKGLDLARNFQFPTLRQPPPSFLTTMEEYIKEAPQIRSVQNPQEYQQSEQASAADESEGTKKEELIHDQEKARAKKIPEEPPPQLIPTGDLLGGPYDTDSEFVETEEHNPLALAIVPTEGTNLASCDISEQWELALFTPPTNNTTTAAAAAAAATTTTTATAAAATTTTTPVEETKSTNGFDMLLLDSLYEDEANKRQAQFNNAGGYGYQGLPIAQNPILQQQHQQHDAFTYTMPNHIVPPPTNVQISILTHQQQQQPIMFQQQQQQMMLQQQQQIMLQQQQQQQQQQPMMMMMMVPYQYPQQQQQQQQQMQPKGYYNPFADPQ